MLILLGIVERATGVEPATSSLGSWHSTAELRPLGSKSRTVTEHCQITSAERRWLTSRIRRTLMLARTGTPWRAVPREGYPAETRLGGSECRMGYARGLNRTGWWSREPDK